MTRTGILAAAAVLIASAGAAQTGGSAGGTAARAPRAAGHVADRRRPAKRNHPRPAQGSNGTTETQTGATNSGMTSATTPQ